MKSSCIFYHDVCVAGIMGFSQASGEKKNSSKGTVTRKLRSLKRPHTSVEEWLWYTALYLFYVFQETEIMN